MSDFVLAVISFLVVLGPLIIIHEIGHFVACRMVGITVLEFGIGIPPRALKLFERNGTEFTLNWLPLGGFVRPLGEDFVRPLGPEATEADRKRYAQYQAELAAIGRKQGGKTKSVMEANPLQRLFFLVAGSAMNFLAAPVLLFLAATAGLPAPAPVVVSNAPGSPAAIAGLEVRDWVIAVNNQPVSTSEEARAAIDAAQPNPVTLTVRRARREVLVTIPPLGADDPAFLRQGLLVNSVLGGAPADGVLRTGDVITRVDSRYFGNSDSFIDYVRARPNQPINFAVVRDGEVKEFVISPRLASVDKLDAAGNKLRDAAGNPVKIDVGQIGINLNTEIVSYSPSYGMGIVNVSNVRFVPLTAGEAVPFALQQSGDILVRLVNFPVQLVRGQLSAEEARPVSFVGISQIGGEALGITLESGNPFVLLNFAALISLALGFTNLLPIPGLDGGRILFVLVEIVRGKPMSPEREGMIHLAGLLLILGLAVLLVVNDLANPLSGVLR
jgi:regulator of sigma E protease